MPSTNITPPHAEIILEGISIVMPVFNGARFIRTTLENINWDEVPNFELIIVDGGSTDDTMEITRQYASRLTKVRIYQHRSNQVEAINFGIAQSKYSWINWLNSDDLLLPGTLASVNANLSTTKYDFVYGDSFVFTNDGLVRRILISAELDPDMQKTCGNIFQGSLFFSRRCFQECGPLDPSLKVAFEYKFYDRLFAECRGKYVCKIFAGFRNRPDSISIANLNLGTQEFKRFRDDSEMSISYRKNWLKKMFQIVLAGNILRLLRYKLQIALYRLIRYLLRTSPETSSALLVSRYFKVRWLG